MNRADKKVKEYLDRAKDLAVKVEMNYFNNSVNAREVLEIAKMIQIEERKEVLDGPKRTRTKKNSR